MSSQSNSKIKPILFIIVVCSLIGIAYYGYGKIAFKDSGNMTKPKFVSYQQAIKENPTSVQKTQDTFVFSLDTSNASSEFKLLSIDKYNAVPKKPNLDSSEMYSFSVIQDNNPIYATYFSLPTVNHEEFHEDGTITSSAMTEIRQFELRTPSFNDGSKYTVKDSAGKVLLEGTISNVKAHNNTPDYTTLQ